jgi:SAM-dependent methyltransferase
MEDDRKSPEAARWDARHRAHPGPHQPSAFLRTLDALLPRGVAGRPAPRALDAAGGPGHDAVWLAARGLDVTLADVSRVALDHARDAAATAGVALTLVEVDLERESFPAGPFDLVVVQNFLWRPLFAAFPAALAPGGLLVYRQPTRTNLERNPSPSARFLLEDGELPGLVTGLAIVRSEEGWFDGRHEARLVARKASRPA